ncbi:MAG: hypothetical protein PHC61_13105 [Chitinivibrionales bacterium]|nr:hypothetical protein [Chitinivibrionales bacterium]
MSAVKALVAKDNMVFAGIYGDGVVVSNDSGAQWSALDNGLPMPLVTALACKDTLIFAGTAGSGVLRLNIKNLANSNSRRQIRPDKRQNISAISILGSHISNMIVSFNLLSAAKIHIRLFNAKGQMSSDIANGFFSEGFHKILLHQKKLSEGAYVLNVQSNAGPTESRHVLLLH